MINPNKFIGLKQQESMGPLTDPQSFQQQFNVNRFTQPLAVPGDQNQTMSPMMQTNYPHAGIKQRGMQPLPKPVMTDRVQEQLVQPMQREIQKTPRQTGYERIVRSKVPEMKIFEEPARIQEQVQTISPFRQDDPGTKYNHVGVQELEDKGKIKFDKKGPYVVNKEKLGDGRDTLRLPKNVWKSPKSGLIDDVEYMELANKINKT
jgi:hypothetical protein